MNSSEIRRRVLDSVGRAMGTFSMLRPGDRVAVGVSGGKDSLCLLDALAAHRRRAPFAYDLIAITVDQGKFTAPIRSLAPAFQRLGVEWVLAEEPRTLKLAADGIEHGCDVCSRNRRGALYRIASEHGAAVLALGHTADDCAEALLRNILFNGRIASLPPVADSRKGSIRIIRPLVFVSEDWTREYVAGSDLDPVGCVCGEKEGPRSEIRAFLEEMGGRHADIPESIRAALANVNPYTLFDTKLQKEGADGPVFAMSPPPL